MADGDNQLDTDGDAKLTSTGLLALACGGIPVAPYRYCSTDEIVTYTDAFGTGEVIGDCAGAFAYDPSVVDPLGGGECMYTDPADCRSLTDTDQGCFDCFLRDDCTCDLP